MCSMDPEFETTEPDSPGFVSPEPAGGRVRFQVDAGTMLYLDQGEGQPVVFVHGNPSSSEEFEEVIEALGEGHRCVAVDHIGFGGSDKPPNWDYLPISHAKNFAALMASLELDNVTLVVGDWGGPIGLSWALENIECVRGVVITNTWLWSAKRSLYYQGFSKFMGGPIGRYLTRRHNFFADRVTKSIWGSARELTPELHAQFTRVHKTPDERKGMWVFPREITGSSEWLSSLWNQRRKLDDVDVRILWGMKDIAFRKKELDRWLAEFPEVSVKRLPDVGHFPALEAADEVVAAIRSIASD